MALSAKTTRIALAVAAIALGAGIYVFLHRDVERTDDAQIEARIIALSPKIGGYVTALHIGDNQSVKAGDVLLEIDPADYRFRHDRAEAARQSAQAMLIAAIATLDKAKQDQARLQELGKLASSRQQLDDAATGLKTGAAGLADAQSRLKLAEADVAQSAKDLADTKITAPMDGRIARKGVERGDYVQPGQVLASLVSADLWVIANFKETQLERMKPGQPVEIEIDAFPDHDVHGRIDSFQPGTGARFSVFPPENATGNFVKIVQRVPVKIVLDAASDASLPLKGLPVGPGMSVTATVRTAD